jgi:hypothetical protein
VWKILLSGELGLGKERKHNSFMEQEGRSCAIFYFYYKKKYKIMAYLALSLSKFEARVVRKVTTRTTSLWLLSVHSDVVFFAMLMML